MTPLDPIKAAAEELSGIQEIFKVLNSMVRDAERRAGEAEVNLNALLKCRSLVGSVIDDQTVKLQLLRTEQAAAEKPGDAAVTSSLLAVIPKSIPAVKRALVVMERDIEAAKTYEAIRRIARMADATRLLFHEVEEVRHKAEAVVVLANHRIGRELMAAPDARGGDRRSKQKSLKGSSGRPSLKDQVGSKKRGTRLKQLAAIEGSKVKAVIAELHGAGKDATVSSVLKTVNGDDKAERRAQRERDLAVKVRALPAKRYVVILADPEWQWEPWSRETGMDRAAANHYPTSILPVIAARDVPSIAAADSVLFLWATIPMLPHALVVMAAWGFDYVSHYAWGKDRIGTGFWNREKHELLLIGTRGKVPCPAPGTQWDSLIMAPRAGHSEKPDAFMEMIEQYFPNVPKIELNCVGAPRAGWDAWGNEALANDGGSYEAKHQEGSHVDAAD